MQVVSQVAQAEGCSLSHDAASSIAGLADGDVRCAIQTLQALFASSRQQVCCCFAAHSKSGEARIMLRIMRSGQGLAQFRNCRLIECIMSCCPCILAS
jgi:DNA polymerase III delta prime subunit